MELLRFGIVGALNTLSTLAVIYLLMSLGVDTYISNFVGYACGIVISFLLNMRWTFRSRQSVTPDLVGRFLLAVGLAYIANLATVHMSLRAGVSPYVAQLTGMPVYTAAFYLANKFFVFRAGSRAQDV